MKWKGTNSRRDLIKRGTNRITSRIRKSLELQEILTTTALEVRSFLAQIELKSIGLLQMEVEKSSQNPFTVSVYPRYSVSIFLLTTFRLTREMFVKARRVIVDVASQLFNQLDSQRLEKV